MSDSEWQPSSERHKRISDELFFMCHECLAPIHFYCINLDGSVKKGFHVKRKESADRTEERKDLIERLVTERPRFRRDMLAMTGIPVHAFDDAIYDLVQEGKVYIRADSSTAHVCLYKALGVL